MNKEELLKLYDKCNKIRHYKRQKIFKRKPYRKKNNGSPNAIIGAVN